MEVAFEDGDEFVDVEMTIVVDIDVIEHRHQILFFEFVSEIIDDGQEALQSDLALLALGAAPVHFLDVLSTLIVSARKIYFDL